MSKTTAPPFSCNSSLNYDFCFRTPEEFSEDHVEGAVNIPVLVKGAEGRLFSF